MSMDDFNITYRQAARMRDAERRTREYIAEIRLTLTKRILRAAEDWWAARRAADAIVVAELRAIAVEVHELRRELHKGDKLQ